MAVKIPEVDILNKEARGPFEKEKTKTQKVMEYLSTLKPTREQYEALSAEEKKQVGDYKNSLLLTEAGAIGRAVGAEKQGLEEEAERQALTAQPDPMDEMKREASMIVGLNFKGFTHLRAISPAFTITPYSPSVIAKKLMGDKQ